MVGIEMLLAVALQMTAAQNYDNMIRYQACTDQAAYYIGYGAEPLLDSGRVAVLLCSDVRESIRSDLAQEVGADAAERRMAALDIVLGDVAIRTAFRTRVCKQDISCNAFLDDRGVKRVRAYRAPSSEALRSPSDG